MSQPSRLSRPSLAAFLPDEILLHIFSYISPLDYSHDGPPLLPACNATRRVEGGSRDLLALSGVCTAWRDTAMELLYGSVFLDTVPAVKRFARSLRNNRALARLVRKLDMPAANQQLSRAPPAGTDAPGTVWLASTKWPQHAALEEDVELIMALCEHVTSIVTFLHAPDVARALGFAAWAPRVVHLELRASRKWADALAFPAGALPHLESLALHGFNLALPCAARLPALQHLRLSCCDFTVEWLHAQLARCPAVRAVHLADSRPWGGGLLAPALARVPHVALDCEWGTWAALIDAAVRVLAVRLDDGCACGALPPRLEVLRVAVPVPACADDPDECARIVAAAVGALRDAVPAWQAAAPAFARLEVRHDGLAAHQAQLWEAVGPEFTAWCAQRGLDATISLGYARAQYQSGADIRRSFVDA